MTDRFLLCLTAILFLTSCKTQRNSSQSGRESGLKVINGLAPDSVPALKAATVALVNRNGDAYVANCSGVLIKPDLVVTAAHCLLGVQKRYTESFKVYYGENADFGSEESGGGLIGGIFGGIFGKKKIEVDPSRLGDVKDFGIHPFYSSSVTKPMYDIAWIKLDKPAPKDYRPLKIFNDDVSKLENSEIWFGGFGHQVASNVEKEQVKARLMLGKAAGVKIVKQSILDHLLAVEQGEHITCFGDSGGPAVAKWNNEWQLLGVTHGAHKSISPNLRGEMNTGPEVCHKKYFDKVIYTPIASYIDWLSSAESRHEIELAKNNDLNMDEDTSLKTWCEQTPITHEASRGLIAIAGNVFFDDVVTGNTTNDYKYALYENCDKFENHASMVTSFELKLDLYRSLNKEYIAPLRNLKMLAQLSKLGRIDIDVPEISYKAFPSKLDSVTWMYWHGIKSEPEIIIPKMPNLKFLNAGMKDGDLSSVWNLANLETSKNLGRMILKGGRLQVDAFPRLEGLQELSLKGVSIEGEIENLRTKLPKGATVTLQ